MDAHASSFVRSCSYPLHQIHSICSSLTAEASSTLVHALVSCQLNYVIQLLMAPLEEPFKNLVLYEFCCSSYIWCSSLRSLHTNLRDHLHWLPFHFHTVYKIALMVFRCLRQSGSMYLTKMLIPINTIAYYLQLRSAQHVDLLCSVYRNNQVEPASFRNSNPIV